MKIVYIILVLLTFSANARVCRITGVFECSYIDGSPIANCPAVKFRLYLGEFEPPFGLTVMPPNFTVRYNYAGNYCAPCETVTMTMTDENGIESRKANVTCAPLEPTITVYQN